MKVFVAKNVQTYYFMIQFDLDKSNFKKKGIKKRIKNCFSLSPVSFRIKNCLFHLYLNWKIPDFIAILAHAKWWMIK